jgi:hypothetical protein
MNNIETQISEESVASSRQIDIRTKSIRVNFKRPVFVEE